MRGVHIGGALLSVLLFALSTAAGAQEGCDVPMSDISPPDSLTFLPGEKGGSIYTWSSVR